MVSQKYVNYNQGKLLKESFKITLYNRDDCFKLTEVDFEKRS